MGCLITEQSVETKCLTEGKPKTKHRREGSMKFSKMWPQDQCGEVIGGRIENYV